MNTRIRLKFKGSGLKQEDTTPFTPKNVVNLFIVYELDRWLRDANISLTLKYRFFEAVKLTKYADPDKYKQSGHDKGVDSRSEFSFTDGSYGKKCYFRS